MKQPFYITTTLPYVNAEPHVGFAMELVRADIIARFKKLEGFDVLLNTGTDEHGLKIYRKAEELGLEPQKYVDQAAERFKELAKALSVLPDMRFTRTTDDIHQASAKEFWKKCLESGDIYKKNYKVKYCVGCELEKTESELVDGKCPIHPNLELEIIEEENYFFRFSNFQKPLLDFYEANPNFVIPASRMGEIRKFVERGLEDFSISRLKTKMPWGVPVPDDDNHVMYVWFDALVNYISAIGWPWRPEEFRQWWAESGGVVQYAGKDNLRQQSAMWQAMLMSAKLGPSRHIIINGFITGEGGQKMSKSLGNVINPFDVIAEYGTDALRYFVAREISSFEDGVFTMDRFKQAYNANLANGIGNLASRILKMAVSNSVSFDANDAASFLETPEAKELIEGETSALESFDIARACDFVWKAISDTDAEIQKEQPFKKIKTDKEAGEKDLRRLLSRLDLIATALRPIMPDTADKILDHVHSGKIFDTPLFPRKE